MSPYASSPLGESEYSELVARVQGTVSEVVPPGSSVLVISKGDAALVTMPGFIASHFPQASGGEYAGHHPLDSAAATAALEELRRHGAEYLVIPATARWWLEYYAGFATHLATHGEVIADEPESCLIYGLGGFGSGALQPAEGAPRVSIDQMRDYLEHLVSADAKLVVLEDDAERISPGLAPLTAVGVTTGGEGEPLFAELERLVEAGGDYLIIPQAVEEWFDRSSEAAARIEASCRTVADQRHLCRVLDLAGMRGLRP